MKTTKFSFKILWFVAMSWTALGLALTAWRTFDYLNRLYLPKISLWNSLKAACYVGVVLIGLGIYRLWREFQTKGFFDAKSVMLVKTIGFITMFIAVPNSSFNVLRDLGYVNSNASIDNAEFLSAFLRDFLFESPLFLLLGMLFFIYAGFMQKAIALKSENDNII